MATEASEYLVLFSYCNGYRLSCPESTASHPARTFVKMKYREKFTDLEYTLYESIAFAMLGSIDTVNHERSTTFAGFLDDLYCDVRGADVSGEPGWTIERVFLSLGWESKYPFIQKEDRIEVEALLLRGEREAFWVENLTSEQRSGVLSAKSFWSIVAMSFNEFVATHPDRVAELDSARSKYHQLLNQE